MSKSSRDGYQWKQRGGPHNMVLCDTDRTHTPSLPLLVAIAQGDTLTHTPSLPLLAQRNESIGGPSRVHQRNSWVRNGAVRTAEAVGWVCRYSIEIEGWNVDDGNPADRGEKLLQIRSR
mgnify:CR=1 FL=1